MTDTPTTPDTEAQFAARLREHLQPYLDMLPEQEEGEIVPSIMHVVGPVLAERDSHRDRADGHEAELDRLRRELDELADARWNRDLYRAITTALEDTVSKPDVRATLHSAAARRQQINTTQVMAAMVEGAAAAMRNVTPAVAQLGRAATAGMRTIGHRDVRM